MSKIFKVEMYIDNLCNENYDDIKDILEILENKDLKCTIIKTTIKDTTEYIDEYEDNYEWNTTIEEERLRAINKYFEE